MTEEVTCKSRYKSPYNGDILNCALKGRHTMHRGDNFVWRPKDEMPWVILKEEKPVEKTVETVKPETASDRQVGGTHYGTDLQPIDVIDAWKLDFYEGSALKYLARHRKKNGREDIEKAIHYLQLLLERQYGARD